MYLRFIDLLARIQLAVATGNPSLLRRNGPRVRLSLAKGPTFIEYAILAAIVVGIGFLIRGFLISIFTTLFHDISNAINSNSSGG